MVAIPTPTVFGIRFECPKENRRKVYVCPGIANEDDSDKIEEKLDFPTLTWENMDGRVKKLFNGVPAGEHIPVPEEEHTFFVE